MIVLWIILFIVLLLTLLLCAKIRLIFDYHDTATVTVRYLLFRFDGKKLVQRYLEPSDKEREMKQTSTQLNSTKKKSVDLFGFIDFIKHITSVVLLAAKEHFSHTRVDIKELRVSVGSNDAAKTALLTVGAIQAANGLCAALQQISTLRCSEDGLSISPNFSGDTSQFSLHLVMSTRVFRILAVLMRTYFRFFEGKDNENARNSVKASH